MKITHALLPLFLLNSSFAALTFVLSDDLNPDGSGDDDGNYTNVEGTGIYNENNGGASGDPSTFNAIGVGAGYGGGDDWRAVMNFDLTGLDAPPIGFAYAVTDVYLVLEVSGGSSAGRSVTTIDFYEGAYSSAFGAGAGTLPASSLATTVFNSPNGTFVSTSLGATGLDLNSDSNFILTLDAQSGYYNFGSGLAGNNVGITGTSASDKAPELRIDYELVAVPEPTSITLISLGALGLITRRKR